MKHRIARHASKRGTLPFKTQTLAAAALRPVAGDKCEVKEERSRDEPAGQNPRVVDLSTLEIKFVSCVYKDNGPWHIVAAVVAGDSPSNPKTGRLPSFSIFSRTIVQFGHDCGG